VIWGNEHESKPELEEVRYIFYACLQLFAFQPLRPVLLAFQHLLLFGACFYSLLLTYCSSLTDHLLLCAFFLVYSLSALRSSPFVACLLLSPDFRRSVGTAAASFLPSSARFIPQLLTFRSLLFAISP
jgi:hypothetical protein